RDDGHGRGRARHDRRGHGDADGDRRPRRHRTLLVGLRGVPARLDRDDAGVRTLRRRPRAQARVPRRARRVRRRVDALRPERDDGPAHRVPRAPGPRCRRAHLDRHHDDRRPLRRAAARPHAGLHLRRVATAALVGPAIGGVITQSLSWRWTFYVNLPIGLIALALLLTLHEREEHRGGAIDWPGAAAFAGATTLLLLGVNGTLPLATFAGAIALAAIFVAIERRTAEPLVDLSLLGIPLIGIGLALSLLMGVLQFGATTFVPPFAQGVLARPPIEAGFALSSMGIGWPIGAVATGWFLMRIGMRRAVITGALLSLGGAALFTTLTPESPLALLVLATASVGLGQGVMNPPLLIAVQSAVGYGRRGIVTSLFNFSRSLGG